MKFYEKLSRFLRKSCADNGEFIRYLLWGIITVLFSFISYVLFSFGMDYRIANICSIILTKIFAYLTNKFFVFKSRTKGAKKTVAEVVRFTLSRAFSGAVDFFGLILLVRYFALNDYIGKGVMIVLVTLLNYVLSKKAVFLKEKEGKGNV